MEGPIVWIIDEDMVAQYAATYKIEQSYPYYWVICHYTVEEALSSFYRCLESSSDIPDIVLLDLPFPVQNGWHFLDELKKIRDQVPIMEIYIVSAFANSKDRRRAEQHALVKRYFDKPITKINLDTIFLPSMI